MKKTTKQMHSLLNKCTKKNIFIRVQWTTISRAQRHSYVDTSSLQFLKKHLSLLSIIFQTDLYLLLGFELSVSYW